MKRLFFLLISFTLFATTLTAQTKDREFGVVAFINVNTISMSISINNIEVSTLPPKTILYHKTYSEGNSLINFNGGLSNLVLMNNDTLYLEIELKTLKERKKEYVLKEYKNYTKFYSSERITYPYIPESFEDDKNTGKRSASGFLLSNEGFIITNYHVIENTKKVTVRGVNGNKKSSLSATVVYTDSTNDLAILKLDDKITINSPVYTLRSTACEIGESIFVLGYPLTNAMGEDIKLTDGLVSSQNGYKGDTTSYQISAPVQPGNSGAPLFDKNGAVVGVINAKLSGAENATYAIKLTHVLAAVQKAGVKQTTAANSLAGKPLTQQVKAIQDFVYIVEAE
ncbi:MAG: S1C family serine protease [Bacteroidota bacterium]